MSTPSRASGSHAARPRPTRSPEPVSTHRQHILNARRGSPIAAVTDAVLSPFQAAGPRRRRLKRRAKKINDSPAVWAAARVGLVANGLVHVLIGGIALGVAFGVGGDAGQSGVLNAVAATPGGFLVLWVAAVGLWGLAVFQLTDAAWVGTRDPAKIAYRRTKAVGKSFGFAGIGLLAAFIALGGRSDGDSTAQRFSEWALESPVGVALLVASALVIGALGVGFCLRGVNRTFREDLSTPDGALGVVVTTLGIVGHIAKGVSFLLVGGLLLSAAIGADASRAGGLDGALSAVRDRPYGPVLLAVIAIGLVSFGVYLGARARYLSR